MIATRGRKGDRQGERGGDLSHETPSVPLLRGRKGGQTWPRRGRKGGRREAGRDGRNGDAKRDNGVRRGKGCKKNASGPSQAGLHKK